MTLYQYKLLETNQQAEVLWNDGEFVADRMGDKYNYLLYQLYNFYVEVQYNTEKNSIEKIKSFSSTGEPLAPYLSEIQISLLHNQ